MPVQSRSAIFTGCLMKKCLMENSVKECKPFYKLDIPRIHVHAWIQKDHSFLACNHFWNKDVPKWHAYIFTRAELTLQANKQRYNSIQSKTRDKKTSHLSKEQN